MDWIWEENRRTIELNIERWIDYKRVGSSDGVIEWSDWRWLIVDEWVSIVDGHIE